ncbi:VOC family protein [Gordonia sp. SL306]|uniref:VOC family protein n=1 Tax=Gordonia sp. SL306 TaxID=2995145 RepID=UPI002270426A|nr:VOC family protein [Gordonia sp. SL306]WAC57138.1 VOC family protein [Gordonia sp. SL306]
MTASTWGPITQTAWVVEEIEATERFLSQLCGAGEWTRMPDIEFGDNCTFRGQPADFTAHISLSYIGEMQLELIQPRRGESIYTEFLRTAGPGIHHICFEPQNLDDAVSDAARSGVEVIQSGDMGGAMRFAYLDAGQAGVPCVELAEIGPDMRAFYRHVKDRSSSSSPSR